MFDSIIFDLDGTLWDSAVTVAEAWTVSLEKVGIDRVITKDDLYREMGKPMDVIMSDLFPAMPEEKRLELLPLLCDEESRLLSEKGGTLFPKVRETLERLKEKYRLFIVSNCQLGYIDAFLLAHSLGEMFEGFLCWGDTHLSKGGTNRELIKKYGLKAPVYIGDTEGDRVSAEEAGIPFLFAAYGFGEVNADCKRAESFAEIPKALEGFDK